MQIPKPIVLIILDGWGYREDPDHNAILAANTPNWDNYWSSYPHTLISGSGTTVGLPPGQMGNSEVGHLHMGAGRLVPQDLMRLDQDIETGQFFNNTTLLAALNQVKQRQSKLHILGLLSPGGVHSHEKHLHAMVRFAAQQQIEQVFLHPILDGRDTPPRSALKSIEALEKIMQTAKTGKIASLIGRYYAMDRDQRWDRTQQAYELYTQGTCVAHAPSAAIGLAMAYERNESDEFVKPTAIHLDNETPVTIDDNDVIVFMNFRADRARQLSRSFTEEIFTHFSRMKQPHLAALVTLTQYDETITPHIAYPPLGINNTLGEYISNKGFHQLRIAETEKYAHVTFFFNAGKEKPFPHEDRLLIPSLKIPTYDLQPEMSARELTAQLIKAIRSQQYEFIVCNFANADMVGHSGNLSATIEAIEVIDEMLGNIISTLHSVRGEAVITADHGNAELMYDTNTQQAHTAHTENLVPFIYIGRHARITDQPGSLIDIAPTILHLLNLAQPPEMTGHSIVTLC